MTDPAAATRAGRRESIILHAVAAALSLAVLAPLVWPGYVLSYDMVFVPRQPLRWELVAPASSLPRAVPQDAVVSLLSLVAPGWLLQRLALVGAVYAGALGAGRLVPARRQLTRVVAAVGYAWTPFLAERLLLGQWGLLLAYGALPWLVAAAIGVREGRDGRLPRLIIAAGVCAITPTGGLIALMATVTLTLAKGRASVRRSAVAVGSVVLLNAPWLAAAATTAAGGRSDPAGVSVFAARGENWAGPLGALAGTGGIWNRDTTPVSRASVLVPVVTLVLIGLAVFGFELLRRRLPPGAAARLALVAAGGFLVALLGVAPLTADALAWAVSHVPGAGVLRDGHKFLAPYALLLVLCVALGAERVAERLAGPRARVVLVAIAVLPVGLMPDLAFGGAGALRPVSYPPDWDRVAELVAADPGEVLALPFSEYRAYAWNNRRTVIDPAPRYLAVDVVLDDRLRIGDVVLAGEDPRAALVRDVLARGDPVTSTGIPWVLVQHDAGGVVAPNSLVGLRSVYRGRYLDLFANPRARPAPDAVDNGVQRVAAVGTGLLAGSMMIAAIWSLRRSTTPW